MTEVLTQIEHSILNSINPNYDPCLLRDTNIVTDQDEVPVQDLKVGDRVLGLGAGFDVVDHVGPVLINDGSPIATLTYPAQSVGNYMDLTVSPGCRVFPRAADNLFDPTFSSISVLIKSQKHAVRQYGHFCFYCIKLRNEGAIMANGAIVSTLKLSSLVAQERRRIELEQIA